MDLVRRIFLATRLATAIHRLLLTSLTIAFLILEVTRYGFTRWGQRREHNLEYEHNRGGGR